MRTRLLPAGPMTSPCSSARRTTWFRRRGDLPQERSTPLGPLGSQAGCGGHHAAVLRRADLRRRTRGAFARVQLPFLARLLPAVPIVPIVISARRRRFETWVTASAGAATARPSRGEQRPLALSGCAGRGRARWPCQRGGRLRRGRPDGLSSARACVRRRTHRGGDARGPPRLERSTRACSLRRFGDSGDKSAVVSYMAASSGAFRRCVSPPAERMDVLSTDERRELPGRPRGDPTQTGRNTVTAPPRLADPSLRAGRSSRCILTGTSRVHRAAGEH
jgi:hypothetical protein